MPERDWQRDWEIATSLPETIGLVYCANSQEVVVAGIDATNLEQRGLVMEWLDTAREGWPAALEKIRELTEQVNELRMEVREWICDDCKYVFPEVPIKGFNLICPKCNNGLVVPKGFWELRQREIRIRELEEYTRKLEEENRRLQAVVEAVREYKENM